MSKIPVLIVEDSAVVRELLEHIIQRDPRLEVAGVAGSAEEALHILDRLTPGVIAMDIQLPGMDGLEATRRIMSRKPIPIVVVAASVESNGRHTAMEALRAGALTVLEKPVGITHADYEAMAKRLCTQLAIMSEVKLVRRTLARPTGPEPVQAPLHRRRRASVYTMLGIACSTGGPVALPPLLAALGPDFPLPILLVQHVPSSHLRGFASWLEGVCPFLSVVVRDGEIPTRGAVHMAPAECHLRLESGRLWLDSTDPVSFQRPSGTVLFQSMARSLGPSALGLLLTGMGDDGARGLFEIQRAGGYTIAEHESTAVVYGMPGAAARLGAAREMLPLPEIGPRVLKLVSNGMETG